MKKLFALVILLLTVASSNAQTSFKASFNHLALSVKDLKRSVEFYTTVFELSEITNRTQNPTICWVSLNDGKELHLISNTEPVTMNKSVHVAFSIPDFEVFIKHLIELKIAYGDWGGKVNAVTTRADGIKQIYLQDPDGYWIEINNAK